MLRDSAGGRVWCRPLPIVGCSCIYLFGHVYVTRGNYVAVWFIISVVYVH